MIPHGARVPAEKVGVDVHRSRKLRRGGEGQLRLAVFDVQVAGQHRLPFLHNVHVGGATRLGGKDLKLDALTGAVDGAFRAQQNLVFAGAGGKLNMG